MQLAGLSPILSAISGLIIWAAHFSVVYLANAIACARGFARADPLGLPLVPVMILGATVVAFAAVALIGAHAWRQLDHSLAGEDGEDDPRFLVWLTVAVAALSALAIIWEGLPPLFVRPCA